MRLIDDYEAYRDLVTTGRVTNCGSPLSDLEVMDMRIKIDIAHSLSERAEASKPKWITVTQVTDGSGSECETKVMISRINRWHDKWIMTDSYDDAIRVRETADQITAKIKAALESATDKAATPDSATASDETKINSR